MNEDRPTGELRSRRPGFLFGSLIGAFVVAGAWIAVDHWGPGLSNQDITEALGLRSYVLTIPEDLPEEAMVRIEWRRGIDETVQDTSFSMSLEDHTSRGTYHVIFRDLLGTNCFEMALMRGGLAVSRFTIEKPPELRSWSYPEPGASLTDHPLVRGTTGGAISPAQRRETDLTLHVAIR